MERGTVRSYPAQIGQYCSSSRRLLHICPLFHGQILCLHRSSQEIGICFEEGFTIDEEDPDLNIDLHYLFKNFAYGQRMETSFYAPHLKGSFY